jgi:hypothetical protein
MDPSNFTAGLGQYHNKTVAQPGSPCPNPITHPFDTDADSDPDPEPASPLTSSDDLKFGPETYTYTYTAKRYTFTYTRMQRVRVRVRVRGLPFIQIIVEIEIEIEIGIGIDPCPDTDTELVRYLPFRTTSSRQRIPTTPQKKACIRASTLLTPGPGRKRHRASAPLREIIRMGKARLNRHAPSGNPSPRPFDSDSDTDTDPELVRYLEVVRKDML